MRKNNLVGSCLASAIVLGYFDGAGAREAPAQPECTRASLPAYSHNDYANAQPLMHALSTGYSGVEVDVFLVDGELRVGHDRPRAAVSGTLEGLYLAPLAALVARCGRLTSLHSRPFLLALEIKEQSQLSHDSVVRLLERYDFLPDIRWGQENAPIEVIMVGWYPTAPASSVTRHAPVKRQRRISGYGDTLVTDPQGRVGLISIDYGKTIGRRWRSAAGRRRWLRTLAAAKRNAGGRALRVHNVPVDSSVYVDLLAAGVDLIGTKQLSSTRQILLSLAHR